jgi:hypothetical protein
MRIAAAVFAVAALAGAIQIAAVASASACSIRGQYCGYPSWAANIFEGRKGFLGNPAILTDQYGGQPPRKITPKRR